MFDCPLQIQTSPTSNASSASRCFETSDGQLGRRRAGLEGREHDLPVAILIGGGRGFLALELSPSLFHSGVGRAPDRAVSMLRCRTMLSVNRACGSHGPPAHGETPTAAQTSRAVIRTSLRMAFSLGIKDAKLGGAILFIRQVASGQRKLAGSKKAGGSW